MMPRILGLLLCAAGLVAAEGWHQPEALWRYQLEVEPDAGAGADMGTARIWPQGPAEGPLAVALYRGDQRLGCEVIWQAPGDPLLIRFPTGGRPSTLTCYVGPTVSDGPDWQPRSGVVVESRALPDGANGDSVKELLGAWERATVIQGRSLTERIHHGYNPHGPSTRCLLRYQAWLHVDRAGRYRFATVSDDASLVLIDGKPVAKWLGWHGASEGRHGRYDGAVSLTPGRHLIDYLLLQGEGGLCASLAWQPPGDDHLRVIEAEAFAGVDPYRVTAVTGADGRPLTQLTWEPTMQAISGKHQLIAMHFTAQPPRDDLRWRFDDGSSARGASVRRLFLRGGLRQVRVFLGQEERRLAVNVRRRWDDRIEWPEKLAPRIWRQAIDGDLQRLPVADLLAAIDWAEELADDDARRRLADVVLERLDAFPAAGQGAIRSVYRLAFTMQDQHLRRYQDAATILDAVAGWSATPPRLRAQARLHMAGNLIHHLDQAAAGEAVLTSIAVDDLPDGDRRLRLIFLGDAALFQRQADAARRRYRDAGVVVAESDLHFATRRRVRLEAAKDYLRREEFDAAEQIVHEIQWETPLERLASECTWLLNAIRLGRGDARTARQHLEAFLACQADDPRESELLLLLVRASLADGQQELAASTAERLRRDHPYSEAAVRVADLIGVQP